MQLVMIGILLVNLVGDILVLLSAIPVYIDCKKSAFAHLGIYEGIKIQVVTTNGLYFIFSFMVIKAFALGLLNKAVLLLCIAMLTICAVSGVIRLKKTPNYSKKDIKEMIVLFLLYEGITLLLLLSNCLYVN